MGDNETIATDITSRIDTLDAAIAALTSEDATSYRVWGWRDAPDKLRRLSHHGGDEDWVAVCGPEVSDDDPAWAMGGSAFGCCDVQRVDLAGGLVVLIGAHA